MNGATSLLAVGLVTAAFAFAVHALRAPEAMARAGPAPPPESYEPRVDVNRAGVDEWVALDGIGPKLAAEIVAARPFARIDDIAKVRGVGRRRLARVRSRLVLDETEADRVR